MKFFRQTKETKRKLSFFMALAMVISLLPVSPVAKAATDVANVTVNCNVTGAAASVKSDTVSGTAIITLTAEEGYKFDNNNQINVTTGASVAKATNCTVAAVTDSAMENNKNVLVTKNRVNDSTYKITVKNISANITIGITGSATKDTTTPDSPTPPVTKEKCTITIKDTLGDKINLTVTNGDKTVANGGEVDKDAVLDIKVAPADGFIFKTAPTCSISSGASITTKFAETSGVYTAKIKVTADTTITVSGGKVTKVESTVTVPDNNANGATIDEGAMKNPKVLDSILNAFASEMVSGTAIGIDKVKELLAASGAAITTSFEVKSIENAYTEDTAASNLANKATTLPEGMTKADVAKMIKDGAALDITLNSVLKSGDVEIETKVTKLGTTIKITMSIPDSIKKEGRTYYVIRLHGNDVDILKCTPEAGGKISFESDKFSTYIVTFTDKPATPTPTGGNNSSSIGGGGYVPSNSATPAPSATAAPSASPSADPSAAPGADSSAAPTESGAPTTGGDTTPTKAPAATDKPVDTDKDNTNGGSTAVKVGKKATVSGSQYKVTAVKGTRTVQFTKGKKNAKSIVVPSTVKISGKNYKVTTIAKNAFKGNKKLAKVTIGKNVNKIGVSAFQNCSKLKSIIIKSTKLTAKKVGKNAFKGINKKATFKVPKSKVKAYKKIVKAKGAGKNVKVKK